MMKKIFALVLLGIFLFCGVSYGTEATVSETEYGYQITGGTEATLVANKRIRIRTISYCANTANNVLTLQEGRAVSGEKWYMKATSASNSAACYMYFGENGVVFDCLEVTLPEGADIVTLYY